jgi:drug/metabolite transporter (DMT)-like permease
VPAAALLLILLSAGLHASWNLLLKQHKGDRTAFSLAFLWVGAALFLPVALGALRAGGRPFPVAALPWAGLSILFESTYWLALSAAYDRGDMSQVYPVARGTGALGAALLGVLLLGERLSPVATAGIGLIVAGCYINQLPALTFRSLLAPLSAPGPAIRLALATGLSTSLYTVVDKVAVGRLGAPPVPYLWLTLAGPAAVLTLTPGRRRLRQVRALGAGDWRRALAVGLLSPVTYLLVLLAMRLSPVSAVAAAREVTLIFGAILGVKVLGEGYGPPRIVGAAGIALGVIALALGR